MSKVELTKEDKTRLGKFLSEASIYGKNKTIEYSYCDKESGKYYIEISNQSNKVKKIIKYIYTEYYQILSKETTLICLSLPESGKFDFACDHDSSEKAWRYYKNMCRASLTRENSAYYYNDTIEVNGDVNFNFGYDSHKYFRSIVRKSNLSDSEKQNTYKRLNCCALHNYEPINFSLMPVTGNLQAVKQKFGNDRFDTFIYTLDLFYKGDELLLCQGGSIAIENRRILRDTLKSFNGVYDFCEKLCFIQNKNLVNKLIQSGKKPILEIDRVNEYIDLAILVWAERSRQTRFPGSNE